MCQNPRGEYFNITGKTVSFYLEISYKSRYQLKKKQLKESFLCQPVSYWKNGHYGFRWEYIIRNRNTFETYLLRFTLCVFLYYWICLVCQRGIDCCNSWLTTCYGLMALPRRLTNNWRHTSWICFTGRYIFQYLTLNIWALKTP